MAKDPICGMQVSKNSTVKVTKDGKDLFFCSTHCKDKFIKRPFFKNKLFIVSSLPVLLILLSFFTPHLVLFRQAFPIYLKAIWRAVLLGLFLGGLINYYIPQEYISKILSRKRAFTIFNAVFSGFLMSACSHGILALSIQLQRKGASNPAVVSFLLASPWVNFTITVMLIGFFSLKGLFIIVAAIIVAINTGFIYEFLQKKGLIDRSFVDKCWPAHCPLVTHYYRAPDYSDGLYSQYYFSIISA